jgi:hypothetical protein
MWHTWMALMTVIWCTCCRYSSTVLASTSNTSSYVGRSSSACTSWVNLRAAHVQALLTAIFGV